MRYIAIPLYIEIKLWRDKYSNPLCSDILKYVSIISMILLQIADATTNKEYNFAVDNLCDIIELAGCSMLTLKMSRKQELVDAIVHFVMVDRVQKALKQ